MQFKVSTNNHYYISINSWLGHTQQQTLNIAWFHDLIRWEALQGELLPEFCLQGKDGGVYFPVMHTAIITTIALHWLETMVKW